MNWNLGKLSPRDLAAVHEMHRRHFTQPTRWQRLKAWWLQLDIEWTIANIIIVAIFVSIILYLIVIFIKVTIEII